LTALVSPALPPRPVPASAAEPQAPIAAMTAMRVKADGRRRSLVMCAVLLWLAFVLTSVIGRAK
jgi:hypothetical protein